MTINLNPSQNQRFSSIFLKEYMSRGHGNMTKREVDVLIFKILHNDLNVFKGLTNHLIAMQLRTTPSKVKNLKYEALLRFPPEEENVFTQEYFEKQLIEYFKDPTFKVDKGGNWIYIQMDDPIVQDAFKAVARNNKEVIDGSFSGDIIKISQEGYLEILLALANKDKVKEANKAIKKALKKENVLSLRNLGDKALSEIMSQGLSKAPTLLTSFSNSLLSCDWNQIMELLNQIS